MSMSEYSLDHYTCAAEARIGQFSRFGSVLGLERIQALLRRLGSPQETLRVIHVAGTNGKGSVCRYIYSVLEEAGYRVGLFTSPYIERFHERIEYDGRCITDEELDACTDRVIACAEAMKAEGQESPTEFEIITAVAMVFFAEKTPDFVILEVGLGGRGDSTNVIAHPLVDIITSISYDHMDRLGNTLAEIAGEKAGIIRPGTPVVSMVSHEDAEDADKVIARTAYQRGCRLYDAARYVPRIERVDCGGSTFSVRIGETEFPHIHISMGGVHQVDNAVCALTAIEILRRSGIIKLNKEALAKGMDRARQNGRFEIFEGHPTVVLDGAHNQEGMESLVTAMDDCFHGRHVLPVLGILKDKAVDAILDKAVWLGGDFIATAPDNVRRLAPGALAEKLRSRGKRCRVIEDAAEAFRTAVEQASDDDVVLVAGSLYLVGRIRSLVKHGA